MNPRPFRCRADAEALASNVSVMLSLSPYSRPRLLQQRRECRRKMAGPSEKSGTPRCFSLSAVLVGDGFGRHFTLNPLHLPTRPARRRRSLSHAVDARPAAALPHLTVQIVRPRPSSSPSATISTVLGQIFRPPVTPPVAFRGGGHRRKNLIPPPDAFEFPLIRIVRRSEHREITFSRSIIPRPLPPLTTRVASAYFEVWPKTCSHFAGRGGTTNRGVIGFRHGQSRVPARQLTRPLPAVFHHESVFLEQVKPRPGVSTARGITEIPARSLKRFPSSVGKPILVVSGSHGASALVTCSAVLSSYLCSLVGRVTPPTSSW